jgi:predicted nucleotidyltransferase
VDWFFTHDKAGVEIFCFRDERLEDSDNLEAAVEPFREIADAGLNPAPCGNRMIRTMSEQNKIQLPREEIAEFCKRNRIRKLSLFGSALRENFRQDSDVDLLVEFQTGAAPSFLDLARMERELAGLLGGRKIDLRTPKELSRYFRDEVLSSASVQYAEG